MHPKIVLTILLFTFQLSICNYYNYINKFNMDFYRNRTRPSKAVSFSNFNNYFGQNSLKSDDKVKCGTRTVDFNPQRLAKIVGGAESPYGAFPWQVEIQLLDADKLTFEHHCGGAIVAERLLVSAAHCFDKQPLQLEQLRVVTGEHRLKVQDPHESRFLVEKVIMHPEFRKKGPHSNDIALVAVSRTIQYNRYVRPICLPESGADLARAGRWCSVSGWGLQKESTESFSPVLRAAAVPLLELATCRASAVLGGRQQPILDSMICAGALTGGVDACRGDSGGPLACSTDTHTDTQFTLVGVVSWGAGCARRARPGVYTRVASYTSWLRRAATTHGYTLQ